MTVLSDLANKAVNNPSTFLSYDRAVSRTQIGNNSKSNTPVAPAADADATIVLACSPSPTGSVQSLQAKLLAARKKNELLVELEKGVDSEGYPLCQYRKGFIDHLKGKAPFISVSRAEYNMI